MCGKVLVLDGPNDTGDPRLDEGREFTCTRRYPPVHFVHHDGAAEWFRLLPDLFQIRFLELVRKDET